MPLNSQIDSHKIYEGYLHKKGVYNKSFQARYFVLYDDRTVDYFKLKSHSSQRNKAKGTIHLTQIKRVELVRYDDNKSNTQLKHSSECFPDTVISSNSPPPDYNKSKSMSDLKAERHRISPPLHRKTSDSLLFESKQRWSSLGAGCCLHDYDLDYDVISSSIHNNPVTPRDAYDVFHIIRNGTKLGLKCDAKYAFALISGRRKWILAAENNNSLKKWVTKLHKLCQGTQVYDGYLNGNKYFRLYKNKVLNCYDSKSWNIEFDIDLRHILYIKYDCYIQIEIAVQQREKNIVLISDTIMIANEWYNKIVSLFKKVINKKIYDSFVENINIIHNGQQLKHRHIAMYGEYIVIFNDENQFTLWENMQFFNKAIFRDYIRKSKCILVPINKNIKVRKASKNHGKYAFLVSNADGERKWYFSLRNKEILWNWMKLLCTKTNNKKPRSLSHNNCNYYHDTMIESTLSHEKEEKNHRFQFPVNKIKRKKSKSKSKQMFPSLPPILDDHPSTDHAATEAFKMSPVAGNDSYKSSPSMDSFASSDFSDNHDSEFLYI